MNVVEEAQIGSYGFEFKKGEKMMNVDVYEEEEDEDHRKSIKLFFINDLALPLGV